MNPGQEYGKWVLLQCCTLIQTRYSFKQSLNEVKRSIIGEDMSKIKFSYLRKNMKNIGFGGIRSQNPWLLGPELSPLGHDVLQVSRNVKSFVAGILNLI